MSQLFGSGKGGGVLSFITPSGKVPGTGLKELTKILGGQSAKGNLNKIFYTIKDEIPNLFGGYPCESKDVAPSALFVAIFGLITVAYFYIFIKNYRRGQVFWPSFGLGVYALIRVIGFGLRIKWAENVTDIDVAITSSVFSFVPALYISIINMLFGHRIFTWRHPETGNAVWFNTFMNTTYCMVVPFIVIAIVSQAVPAVHYLSEEANLKCVRLMQAMSVLNSLFPFAGLILIAFAYIFPPGTLDHQFGKFHKKGTKETLPYTISATWIENTGMFYFPKKGSQFKFLDTQPEGKAVRIIPSINEPAGGFYSVHHGGVHTNGPRMISNVVLIAVTSVLLSVVSCFRSASTFLQVAHMDGIHDSGSHWVYSGWLFYLTMGAFEVIVNVLYLILRVDLRFYIPDEPINTKKTGKGVECGGKMCDYTDCNYMYKENENATEMSFFNNTKTDAQLRHVATNNSAMVTCEPQVSYDYYNAYYSENKQNNYQTAAGPLDQKY